MVLRKAAEHNDPQAAVALGESYDPAVLKHFGVLKFNGDVALARVTYTQFQANLVAAEADQLTREAVLRNILGLPPSDGRRIVPVSAPASQRLMPHWEELVRLAEQRRPDIIELKLVTEADQVRLLQSQNQALPRLL